MSREEFPFQKRIQDLTEDFVGRGWMLDQLDSFLKSKELRCFLIEGKPGTGKSVLAAHFVKTQEIQIHAYHFCSSREGGTLEPTAFVSSVSRQLVNSIPGFGKKIVEQPPVQKIDVSQDIEKIEGGQVYGVYIDKFIVQTPSADAAFQFLVREPLKSWAKGRSEQDRVVILVDALDEAARLDRTPNIVGLIEAARDLPAQVRWVLTTRPKGPLAIEPDVQCVILDEAADNLKDLGLYIDDRLENAKVEAALESQTVDPALLREELLKRSEGNFLYLKYVLDDLSQDVKEGRPLRPFADLPEGLDAVYLGYLVREKERGKSPWSERHRPVLGVLAVAHEAVPFGALAAFSGVESQEANTVIQGLIQLLDETTTNGDASYRLYHTSFADFLTDRKRSQDYWTDPVHYNRRIADYAFSTYQGQWRDWQGLDIAWPYAVRNAASHLSNAAGLCREQKLPSDQHLAIRSLVRLTLNREFRVAYLEETDDIPGLSRIMDDTLRRAAEDPTPQGLPLAVEAALGLVEFRHRKLAPAHVFDSARRGDVAGAERSLDLFPLEREWRQACLVLVSWLAADKNRDQALHLFKRLEETSGGVERLWRLLDRVRSVLDGEDWAQWEPPFKITAEDVQQTIDRLGRMQERMGLATEEAYEARELPPGESSYAASIRLQDTDSHTLVKYAVDHPEDPHNYVRDQVTILGANPYLQYRNRFLWPVLEAVLFHNADPAWVQDTVLSVLSAAMAPSRLVFMESLPITVLACQAKDDSKWRKQLDTLRDMLVDAVGPLMDEKSAGDTWGSYTRRLAALAQGYHLLEAEEDANCLLDLGTKLHFGYAGFQAPAWLTLAEAFHICGREPELINEVLQAAGGSAHNVQDPTFCVQTTARYNALRLDWWGDPPGGFDVAKEAETFCNNPGQPRFAALHLLDEKCARRDEEVNLPLPSWATDAATLQELSDLYGAPLADFRRLNPDLKEVEDHEDLKQKKVKVVHVPDPEFTPLLAARFAAEALVSPAIPNRRARIETIRQLLPLAATNPTALDTVLARYVLAAHPLAPDILGRLTEVAEATEPLDPDAWRWLGDGALSVTQNVRTTERGEMTGVGIGRL
jgi:hypothetical protein